MGIAVFRERMFYVTIAGNTNKMALSNGVSTS